MKKGIPISGALAKQIRGTIAQLLPTYTIAIRAITPEFPHAGDLVMVYGSGMKDGAVIVLGGKVFSAQLENETIPISTGSDGSRLPIHFSISTQALTFTLDANLHGGTTEIYVQNPDGTLSLPQWLTVCPSIVEVQQDGLTTQQIDPGRPFVLVATLLEQSVKVFLDGVECPSSLISPGQINVNPWAAWEIDNGTTTHSVYIENEPSGAKSEIVPLQYFATADIGFRASRDGYGFQNFSKGDADYGCYKKTYAIPGPPEIFNPLFWGFSALWPAVYEKYLNGGKAAHCMAMSAASLQAYLLGYTYYMMTPQCTPQIKRTLDWIQGRLLSDELLAHYSKCMGRANGAQIAVQAFENSVLAGQAAVDYDSGVIISFIPTVGGISWTKIELAHTVVPMRIVYQNGFGNLDEAKLFIYDSNYLGDDGRFINLWMEGGTLHFEYSTDATDYSTKNGWTLAEGDTSMADESKKVHIPFWFAQALGAGLIGL